MNLIRTRFMRFGLSLAAVVAGLLLRWAIEYWTGPGLPTYITFYPAVMLVALLAGFWPGIVATLAAVVVVDYFLLGPSHQFGVDTLVDDVGQIFFAGVGVLMSVVAGLYHRIRDNLKNLVEERTKELGENEARLRRSQEIAHLGSWELDLVNSQLTWSDEVYRIFGLKPQEFGATYQAFLERVHPDDRAAVDAAYSSSLRDNRDGYDIEHRVVRNDTAEVRVVHEKCEHFRDTDGKIVRSVGMVHDITERKRAEEALRDAAVQKQAAQYSRTLIEVSIDPLVTISAEGKITDVNEATLKATGVSRNELIGTDFSNYFTEPEKARDGYRRVFAKNYVTDYPLTIRHRDGRLTDVLYNASVYRDADGNVLGVFAAARDVTAQNRAEAELKRHRDSLEILVKERTTELEESNKDLARSNENLGQFAYVASHDLQEPLRIMASYSQLLEKRYKDKLDKNADEFIEYIVGAAARMQKLIADLLAYSRAGHKGENLEDVDCNEVVHKVVDNMAATIQEAGGSVIYDSLPVIRAHEAGMIQLFQNLIGNALKFRGAEPPKVHVSAKKVSGHWAFSVRDNGIGIEPQYFDRIFVIFQRLHAREKYTGTGIGLSICKKIVDNLGGRIWVESKAGKGSTFHFTVPEGGK